MGYSFRHFLFPEDGEPLRIAQRVWTGLIFGEDAIPKYAGTRQRVLSVLLDSVDGKPGEVFRVEGSIFVFDQDGKIQEGMIDELRLAMSFLPTPDDGGTTVIDFQTRQNKHKLKEEYRWNPTQQELDRVLGDIWIKSGSRPLAKLEGIAPRRPPLTWEAKEALREVSSAFFTISHAIGALKEPSLKSFAFEARRRAEDDPEDGFLYRAAAEMAEHSFNIIRRRRSTKGTWYALLEIIMWKDGVGEAMARQHQGCQGKRAAIAAGRKMLAEHADRFDDGVTVEVEILTELEWQDRQKSMGGS